MVVDLFNTDPQPDSLIGRKLDGRYEMLGRLGEGGVGVVYRARQVHLGREVAIKVLHKDAAAIPEWRRRFEREAQALSALAHPNVVPVTDSGIDNGVPFLVMELLQGKTLADLLKEGPLPLWRALDIARQLLRGLAFAHGKGIVHRDLKPANVFLQELPDQADHVRLLDFGMVKFLEKADSGPMADTLTRAGVVFGTPAYLSPEQAKGGPADAQDRCVRGGLRAVPASLRAASFHRRHLRGRRHGAPHAAGPIAGEGAARARGRAGVPAGGREGDGEEAGGAIQGRGRDAGCAGGRHDQAARRGPEGRAKEADAPPAASRGAPSRFWRRALMVVAVGMGVGAAAVYLRLRHDEREAGRDRGAARESAPQVAKADAGPRCLRRSPPRPALPRRAAAGGGAAAAGCRRRHRPRRR